LDAEDDSAAILYRLRLRRIARLVTALVAVPTGWRA
jgi:hypothetical protein